jgi:hypothetical protein
MRWHPEGTYAVFLFVQEFSGEQPTNMKVTLIIFNTISKGFINELTRHFPKWHLSLLNFPVSTSELSASTTLIKYKEMVQHK